jgi:DNA-binding LacI/PurR family transcriptional regulator
MSMHGLPVDESLVVESDFTFEGGEQAFSRIWQNAQPPSALFAANDQMAMGVLREARRRGIRVPQDLALVGFNGIAAAEQTDPPLTTIHLSLRQIGRMAADLLLRQLKSRQLEQTSVLIRGELVARGTTVAQV